MVRSLHQLFCFPRLTDADHLEQQKQKNKHETPHVIPSLQRLLSTKMLPKNNHPLLNCLFSLFTSKYLYCWLEWASWPRRREVKVEGDGINASRCHKVWSLWRQRGKFYPSASSVSEHVNRLFPAPISRNVMPSNATGQIILISQQWQYAYGCTLRHLNSDGGENIWPRRQKRLRAVKLCLVVECKTTWEETHSCSSHCLKPKLKKKKQ